MLSRSASFPNLVAWMPMLRLTLTLKLLSSELVTDCQSAECKTRPTRALNREVAAAADRGGIALTSGSQRSSGSERLATNPGSKCNPPDPKASRTSVRRGVGFGAKTNGFQVEQLPEADKHTGPQLVSASGVSDRPSSSITTLRPRSSTGKL